MQGSNKKVNYKVLALTELRNNIFIKMDLVAKLQLYHDYTGKNCKETTVRWNPTSVQMPELEFFKQYMIMYYDNVLWVFSAHLGRDLVRVYVKTSKLTY